MSSLLSGTVGRQILLKMHSIEISSYSNQEILIYKLYKVHCVVQGTLTIGTYLTDIVRFVRQNPDKNIPN